MSSSSDVHTNRENEEAGTPKISRKGNKGMCQKVSIFNNTVYQVFQVILGVAYFVVCLVGVLAHLSNYQLILEKNVPGLSAKPSSLDDVEWAESNNKIIRLFGILEIFLLVVIVIDLIAKSVSHHILLKANFKGQKKDEMDVYFDEPLTFDPMRNENGLFVLRTEYVAMDAFLVLVILAMYFI